MPKTKTKTKARRPTRRAVRPAARKNASKRGTHPRDGRPRSSIPSDGDGHPYLTDADGATYVLVPVDDYEELVKASMVVDAIAKIENSTDEDYVDADDFRLELAAERIAKARKAKGMTQKQLAAKLKVPQSQISRIERNPDRTTVRTLKRIAKALGVDVSALI